jgi:ABC-type proline/glycine betaine transport system substrate-binding protein
MWGLDQKGNVVPYWIRHWMNGCFFAVWLKSEKKQMNGGPGNIQKAFRQPAHKKWKSK